MALDDRSEINLLQNNKDLLIKIMRLQALCQDWIDSSAKTIKSELKKHPGLNDAYYKTENDNGIENVPAQLLNDLKDEQTLREKLCIDQDVSLGASLPIAGHYLRKFLYPDTTVADNLFHTLKNYQPLKNFSDEHSEFYLALKKHDAITKLYHSLDDTNFAYSPIELLDEFGKALSNLQSTFGSNDPFQQSVDYVLNLESKDPIYFLLNKIAQLPDFNLPEFNQDLLAELGLCLMSSQSYEKNHQAFLDDVTKSLAQLNINLTPDKLAILNIYFSFLRNTELFDYFRAINASITQIWQRLHVAGKLPGEEQYLGGDDMPILLKKLLPNDLVHLTKLNDKLQVLGKLCNLTNQDGYSIIMLSSAVKEKIASLAPNYVTPADEKKKAKLIEPVVKAIHRHDFPSLVDTFAILNPIKTSCKDYAESLLRTLEMEMFTNKGLYQRFKHQNGAIGQMSLLNIERIIAALNEHDEELTRFVAHHTKFRVSLKNYQALTQINRHLIQHAQDPQIALQTFQTDFNENKNLFVQSEEGPGKRFFNRIVSLLSCLFTPCIHPVKMPTQGELFIKRIGTLFPPTPPVVKNAVSLPEPQAVINERKVPMS